MVYDVVHQFNKILIAIQAHRKVHIQTQTEQTTYRIKTLTNMAQFTATATTATTTTGRTTTIILIHFMS